MTALEFKWLQCNDDRPALCQEDDIARVLAFGGVHDTLCDSTIFEQFTTGALSDAHLEASEGTWSITGGTLQGVAGASPQWYKIRHTTEVEIGFVTTFDKTGDNGAFLFCCDDDYKGYMAWWTGTTVGVSRISDTSETKLISLPIAEAGAASVTVGVWPRQYSSIDEIDDLVLMLWFDGKHLLTYSMAYQEIGKKVGFAVYQNETATFDNLHIPQLHQLVEWASVDPGEVAGAGLSRIIGYEQIKVRARYDGTARIWRNINTDVDWTVSADRPLTVLDEQQIFTPSHYRMVGALHEADVFRPGNQGHIFAIGQDPNALTEDETYNKGEREHKTAEGEGHTKTLVMAPNPVIESADVVSADGESWRVVGINYRAAWRDGQNGGAPVLESNVELRECL